MFNCDAPLGMENGNINDDQITAKISSPSTKGPLKSRLRSNDAWCPQAKVCNISNYQAELDAAQRNRVKVKDFLRALLATLSLMSDSILII